MRCTYTPADLIDPVSTLSVRFRRFAPPGICSFGSNLSGRFLRNGRSRVSTCSRRSPTTSRGTSSATNFATGISRAPLRTSGSRFPTAPAIRGTSGSTPPSGTSLRRPNGVARTGKTSPTGGRPARRNPSLHRQGHHLLPHAVLADDAQDAGFKLPDRVHIHGFLTVAGEKMSKSRGTLVRASTYLDHLDPAFLRYYYATKLTDRLDDLDLNLQEFVDKVNSDLVGKVVNLASRSAKFVQETGLAENVSRRWRPVRRCSGRGGGESPRRTTGGTTARSHADDHGAGRQGE